MSCGIESPKQLFRVERRWKGPMLPNGLQTLGGDGLPSTAHFRTSPTDRGGEPPALLTSISSAPKRSRTCSCAATTLRPLLMSQCTAKTSPRYSCIAETTLPAASASYDSLLPRRCRAWRGVRLWRGLFRARHPLQKRIFRQAWKRYIEARL